MTLQDRKHIIFVRCKNYVVCDFIHLSISCMMMFLIFQNSLFKSKIKLSHHTPLNFSQSVDNVYVDCLRSEMASYLYNSNAEIYEKN